MAAGRTPEETRELMRSALKMQLQAMQEDGDPIPEPSYIVAMPDVA